MNWGRKITTTTRYFQVHSHTHIYTQLLLQIFTYINMYVRMYACMYFRLHSVSYLAKMLHNDPVSSFRPGSTQWWSMSYWIFNYNSARFHYVCKFMQFEAKFSLTTLPNVRLINKKFFHEFRRKFKFFSHTI